MRTSWLICALVTFIIGAFFASTLIGLLVGIPLIVLSFILLIVGFILPGKKTEIHIHHHKE